MREYEKLFIPDGLFRLTYRDGGQLYFIREEDRANEDGRPLTFDKKSILRLVLQARAFIGGGLYHEHYGIADYGLLMLITTTTEARKRQILDIIAEVSGGKGNNYILVQVAPEFERSGFQAPHPIPRLFTAPWSRAGKPDFSMAQGKAVA